MSNESLHIIKAKILPQIEIGNSEENAWLRNSLPNCNK